ncbi:MAG: UvrD-helicase domain-containing protein [Balneolales bacterium]|nr:UvrD-helicase domain-containing protein [Balneolales bacterium]
MPLYNTHLFEAQPELLKGNLQIIACAGSGKTEFVSERIAFIIHKNVAQYEQIVAFTFANPTHGTYLPNFPCGRRILFVGIVYL